MMYYDIDLRMPDTCSKYGYLCCKDVQESLGECMIPCNRDKKLHGLGLPCREYPLSFNYEKGFFELIKCQCYIHDFAVKHYSKKINKGLFKKFNKHEFFPKSLIKAVKRLNDKIKDESFKDFKFHDEREGIQLTVRSRKIYK